MRFTDLFIRRPVLAISLSLLIAILGLQALRDLEVREFPEVTHTVITVSTGYFGGGANVMQGFVTQPLEQAIARADNIDFMTSDSQQGRSHISVHMNLNTDPNDALAEVLAKVNAVRTQLPREVEDPEVSISTGGFGRILFLSFNSKTLKSSQIVDYLERVVQPFLYAIEGVSAVDILGSSRFAMRVWLDPERMAAYHLTASEVVSVVRANNYQAAAGQTSSFFTVLNGDVEAQVATVSDLEKLVVASRDDSVVRLGDIAKISLDRSHDGTRALINGRTSVDVTISATPTANPMKVAQAVRDLIPQLRRNMPETINMKLMYDATEAIHESVDEVTSTIIQAALIVILVVTVFLGNWRAVIIPIVTMPLSLIGGLALIHFFGFSLNLMTLLALVLAIGLVVDDAIVVLENVHRHIMEGETPFRAAIKGTREIALPVISMTLTLAAVYAPVALMGGLTGTLFREFALSLAGAVMVSGVIALTLSPMMCAKLLRPANELSERSLEAKIEHLLIWVTGFYQRSLDRVLEHKRLVLVFVACVLLSLPLLFSFIPRELAPSEDRGAFLLLTKAPDTSTLDYVESHMKLVSRLVASQEAMETSLTAVGFPASNQGFGVSILKPRDSRDVSVKEVIAKLSPQVAKLPGISTAVFPLSELPGASKGLPVQFVLNTPNSFESLHTIAQDVLTKVMASPLFVYEELDLAFGSATLKIQIDRDKAGAYGVTMEDIASTLSILMSGGYLNKIDLLGKSYEVIPQVERRYRMSPESLKRYYVKSNSGDMVPLSNLITTEVVAEPRVLPHFDQLNSATIGVVPAPGISMGQAVAFFEEQVVPDIPAGYHHDYLGEARQYVGEGNQLNEIFVLAIIVIFLVLAAQFESLRDPLVILVSVPLALSGALIAQAWGLATMNIYTQIGLITLVGLISKHGILICEVARNHQLQSGCDRTEAVRYAAQVRLRPILMTTFAMVAGLLPLLFSDGAGANSRFGIGLVIVAGLSVGTLFTLYVLPVIYTYVASKHQQLPVFVEDHSTTY